MKDKLVAGRNETAQGLTKFTQAQFYDNLTKEQYAGVVPRNMNYLSSSRDTLNPLLNAQKLKTRLQMIEYYRYRHGEMYARWPHFFMSRVAQRLWRYKLNYAVKGFAAFMVYQEYENYRHMSNVAILTIQQDANFFVNVTGKAAAFGAVCCLI